MDELPPALAGVDPPPLEESVVCLVLEHAVAARPMEMATASRDDVLLRLMLVSFLWVGFLQGAVEGGGFSWAAARARVNAPANGASKGNAA